MICPKSKRALNKDSKPPKQHSVNGSLISNANWMGMKAMTPSQGLEDHHSNSSNKGDKILDHPNQISYMEFKELLNVDLQTENDMTATHNF